MRDKLKKIRNRIHPGKTATLISAMVLVAVAVIVGLVAMPKVDAANESGSQGNPIVLRADYTQEQTVEPGKWYKITGSTTETYLLKYSGNGSDPAHIILEGVDITLTSDIPAIKLTADEDQTSSYQGNFEIHIRGENRIVSTYPGAKSPLIQADRMEYTVRTYDHNSNQTEESLRFREENVIRNVDVIFSGDGQPEDSLTLITAEGSYGAAIGSGELGQMGEEFRYKPGSGTRYYLGPDLGYYQHGQQELKADSTLKCGSGNIQVNSGAVILIEGNGFGPGIGAGASEDSTFNYRRKNAMSSGSLTPENGRTDAIQVLSSGNIEISSGSVYVDMGDNALGACLGTGAIAGNGFNQGTVVIDGGNVDLRPAQEGYEFGNAVNSAGQELHPYVFHIQEAAEENNGTLVYQEIYPLENVDGGEQEYDTVNEGSDATLNDYLRFTIPINENTEYVFAGYGAKYFGASPDEKKCLYFWLPSEILPTRSLVVDGDLQGVQYEYRINNGTYQTLVPGSVLEIKQTKTVDIRISGVPEFCTNVSYRTAGGQTGSLSRESDGTYLYRFTMPAQDYTITFSYEIGSYQIQYENVSQSDIVNENPTSAVCGTTVELSDPEWEDRIFDGWYTSADFAEGTRVTEVSSETVNEVITLYAKWICKVSFVDDEGNTLQDDMYVDLGTRITENMYPADPQDTQEKVFTGWMLDGQVYPVGSRPEFTADRNTTVTATYKTVGYFIYVNALYTDQQGVESAVDIQQYASFEMFFRQQPIEFEKIETENGVSYKTVNFADRTDETTANITAKTGYKITAVDVVDSQGAALEVTDSPVDEHGFSFQMPASNVYITVHIQAPDFTISYHDSDGSVITPVETEGNPTRYTFNATTEEFRLNPAPQKDKYHTFAGWYVLGDPDQPIITTIPTGVYDSDLILVATWNEVETYPITIAEEIKPYVKVVDAAGAEVTEGIPGEMLSIVVTEQAGIRFESVTYSYEDEYGGVYTNKKTPSEDQQSPYQYAFLMPAYDINITGEFSEMEYTITYLNMEDAENPNPTTYKVNDVIELQDPVKAGNKFTGWTIVLPDPDLGYESVREEEISVIEGRIGNLILVAHWEKTEEPQTLYKISIQTEEISHGTLEIYEEEEYPGRYVFVHVSPDRGYRLESISYRAREEQNWIQVTEDMYCFVMPQMDVVLTAQFVPIEYTLTYQNGENPENPDVYTVESEIVLKPAEKEGYEFLGWFDEQGNQITELKDDIGDLILTAQWRSLTDPEQGSENTPGSDEEQSSETGENQDEQQTTNENQSQNSGTAGESGNNSSQSGGNKGSNGEQIFTGDRANISHLVLICILSLIILILAFPKKEKKEEV